MKMVWEWLEIVYDLSNQDGLKDGDGLKDDDAWGAIVFLYQLYG